MSFLTLLCIVPAFFAYAFANEATTQDEHKKGEKIVFRVLIVSDISINVFFCLFFFSSRNM